MIKPVPLTLIPSHSLISPIPNSPEKLMYLLSIIEIEKSLLGYLILFQRITVAVQSEA
jgi:hypothetical protein